MIHYLNVCDIRGDRVQPVDIVSFGSPCQDLSVAGKRAGLKHEANGDDETTRSGLFMEAVRIIKEMRRATNGKYPTYALWENVPGAFSSNKGEDFRVVLEELAKISDPSVSVPMPPKGKWSTAGALDGDNWSIAWRTVDAQYHGVAQRRRRILLVADLTGKRAREISFKCEGLPGYPQESGEARQGAAPDAEAGARIESGHSGAGDGRLDDVAIGYLDGYGGLDCSQISHTLIARMSSAIGTTQDNLIVTQPAAPGPCTGTKPEKIYYDAEMEVEVRKYQVDTEKLKTLLREKKGSLTNRAISERLNKPLTLVEHWFRQDDGFAVPDVDIWPALKTLLGIDTDAFDRSILTYERKEGAYDMRNRIYTGDKSPTLTSTCGNNLHLVPQDHLIVTQPVAYGLDRASFNQGTNAKYDFQILEEQQPTLTARGPGATCAEAYVTTTGSYMQVEKEKSPCLMARDYKDPNVIAFGDGVRYIVRRLTPTECARLQGFPDDWGHLPKKDDFTDEEMDFWNDVYITHQRVINNREAEPKNKNQLLAWYNKLWTDSAEYKMWGNGVALPCVRVPVRNMAKFGARTLASLFDGSGGFPLAGVLEGITPVWCSEIEPYPIAVTVNRFPEIPTTEEDWME